MYLDMYPSRDEMRDPDALIARCRRLGVAHVCLSVGGWPGEADRGPDPADLRHLVRRLDDAGIGTPAIINSFGVDPAMTRDPAGFRPKLDAACRLLETIARAGIGVLLNYIHAPMPADPADDDRAWDALTDAYRRLVAAAEATDVRIANHAIWRCWPTCWPTSSSWRS